MLSFIFKHYNYGRFECFKFIADFNYLLLSSYNFVNLGKDIDGISVILVFFMHMWLS